MAMEMTQQDALTTALLFRIGERLTLTVIIVVLSCVVMIAFWRSIQRVDFQASRDKVGVAGSIVLSTPVFLILALVGYTYVSLSNPITIDLGKEETLTPGPAVSNSRGAGFTGITSNGGLSEAVEPTDNTDFERQRAVDEVRSLNCLAGPVARPSARVQDDFAAVKLRLLKPVWSDDWGAYDAFADSVLGRSVKDPNPKALEIFEGKHDICEGLSP